MNDFVKINCIPTLVPLNGSQILNYQLFIQS